MVATGVGAFLALLAAIYVERYSTRREKSEDKRRALRRRATVVTLVAAELQRNVAELTKLHSSLDSMAISGASPTLDVWRSLSAEILALTLDADLAALYY